MEPAEGQNKISDFDRLIAETASRRISGEISALASIVTPPKPSKYLWALTVFLILASLFFVVGMLTELFSKEIKKSLYFFVAFLLTSIPGGYLTVCLIRISREQNLEIRRDQIESLML